MSSSTSPNKNQIIETFNNDDSATATPIVNTTTSSLLPPPVAVAAPSVNNNNNRALSEVDRHLLRDVFIRIDQNDGDGLISAKDIQEFIYNFPRSSSKTDDDVLVLQL